MKTLKTEKIFFVLFLCAAAVCLSLAAGLLINSGCKKHDPVSYTVTFHYNDGITENSTEEVKSEYRLKKPDDPTRDGYTFDGWLTIDNGPYNFNSKVTENFSLFANWTEATPPLATVKYNVTFYIDGTVLKTEKVEKGGTVTEAEAPEKTGYAFEKWTTFDGKAFDFTTAINDDLDLFADYKKKDPAPPTPPADDTKKFTVTFDPDGGTNYMGVGSAVVKEGEKVAEPEDPAKAHCDFEGWFTAGGVKFDFENTKITEDITLTAHWGTPHYDVTFVYDNGTENLVQRQEENTYAVKPADPAKMDSTFLGWFTSDGKEFDFKTAKITEDITLTAKWQPVEKTLTATSINFNNIDLTDTNTKSDGSTYKAKNYADGSVIEEIITLKGGEWEVDASKGNITDAGGTAFAATQRLKSKGVRTMEIDLSAYSGKVKIQVFVRTGNKDAITRGISITDSDGNEKGKQILTKDEIFTLEVTVDCGSIYTLTVIENGVNFYGINFIPVS